MDVTVGMTLKSAVSSTEVVVVQPPDAESPVALTCGGVPMLAPSEPSPDLRSRPKPDGKALLGKRYRDEVTGLELLCTRGGSGELACDGRALVVKEAKPLPSSD